jgi:hypothetical protein
VFTGGLVWISQERRMALYFNGCKHAGENLAEVLKLRLPDLPPIIQMCDALRATCRESSRPHACLAKERNGRYSTILTTIANKIGLRGAGHGATLKPSRLSCL